SVATWRTFARRELPIVIRQLNLPAASPTRPGLNRCPRHKTVIGPITRLCEHCFTEAWDEVGRRYAQREHGSQNPKGETMNNQTTELVEADAVEVESQAGELAVRPPTTLFRSDDPRLVVARAVEVADELAKIIRDRKLSVPIR